MGGEGWAGGPWARGARGGRKGSGLNPSSPTPRAPPVPPLPACPPERRDGKGDGVPKLLPSPPSLPPPPRPSPSLPLLPLTEPGRERRRVRTSYYEDGLLRGGGAGRLGVPSSTPGLPPRPGRRRPPPFPSPFPSPFPFPFPFPFGGAPGRRDCSLSPRDRMSTVATQGPPGGEKNPPSDSCTVDITLTVDIALTRARIRTAAATPPPPPLARRDYPGSRALGLGN